MLGDVSILVVDAAQAVRSRLVLRLREAGLEVVADVGSADAALAIATEKLPRAVVLDVDLPDRRGLELIALLKATLPEGLLVVLTNLAPYRRACLAAGADLFLDKSRDFDLLAQTLAPTAK
jgi:DNA-binding NarL/FixJ family response regulator